MKPDYPCRPAKARGLLNQIREEFERQTIVVEYVNTCLNLADCLTKMVCERLHRLHTDTLCGLNWDADNDPEYQQELAEDRRSSAFQARKAMLDLEYQHESEEKQRSQTLRACKDAFDLNTGELANAAGGKVDSGSDTLLSKYLAAKLATDAEGTKEKAKNLGLSIFLGGVRICNTKHRSAPLRESRI